MAEWLAAGSNDGNNPRNGVRVQNAGVTASRTYEQKLGSDTHMK